MYFEIVKCKVVNSVQNRYSEFFIFLHLQGRVHVMINKKPRASEILMISASKIAFSLNISYKPGVLFMGHRQTV